MIHGLDSFRKYFHGFEGQYAIIGGTACSILMDEEGLEFRATKDFDIVLILEALTPEFGKRFWDYIKEAGYEHCNKSTGLPQFYRFSKPKNKAYPAMIELFSRREEQVLLTDNAVLTPLHVDDELSSLSAILLDDDYYSFLCQGNVVVDGISILGAEYLIPFKMKAWLDLSKRKLAGDAIDSKNIRKHKNDVFRLSELLIGSERILVPASVYADILDFIEKMDSEEIDLKQLKIVGTNKNEILNMLGAIYIVR